MRTRASLALLAAGLLISGCVVESSILTGPLAPDTLLEDGETVSRATSRVRLVEPPAGAMRKAGASFDVLVRQEIRGVPSHGRGQLQYSSNEEDWSDIGTPFAWSRQSHEILIPDVRLEELGQLWLRLVVYERGPEDPFLESQGLAIQSLRALPAQVVLSGS